MRTKIAWMIAFCIGLTLLGCDSASYKKSKAGWVYKIFPGNRKDSLPKMSNVVKFQFIRKLNDSVLYTSYDKMPAYLPLSFAPGTDYNPFDILYDLRKGDSAIVVEIMDTIINRGYGSQFPGAKKGDRVKSYFKILEVYRSDSLARIDFEADMSRDKPRQEKEMKEMMAKAAQERLDARRKDYEGDKKSGEIEKANKAMETYLASKNIHATKTDAGTYVVVKQQGTGEPVTNGKYITVNYTGKFLTTDSVFESNTYMFQIGNAGVIYGWDDGLLQFKEGGSGTLYIPGYMAYRDRGGPSGKPFDPLIFEVQVENVSDTQEQANAAKAKADSIAAAKKPATVKK